MSIISKIIEFVRGLSAQKKASNQDAVYFTHEAKACAFEAIEMSKKLIENGEALSPFLLVNKDAKGTVVVFEGETLEEQVALAKDTAKKMIGHVDLFAIAYDATLTIAGQKTDAIIVEVSENRRTHILAQRYRHAELNSVEFVDKPKYMVGEAEFR